MICDEDFSGSCDRWCFLQSERRRVPCQKQGTCTGMDGSGTNTQLARCDWCSQQNPSRLFVQIDCLLAVATRLLYELVTQLLALREKSSVNMYRKFQVHKNTLCKRKSDSQYPDYRTMVQSRRTSKLRVCEKPASQSLL